jgi:DNA processing protein
MSVASSPSVVGGREVLPPEAHVVALLSLPALWPARLGALLGLTRPRRAGAVLFGDEPVVCTRTPEEAWDIVRSGRAADIRVLVDMLSGRHEAEVMSAQWAAHAVRTDVGRLWSEHRRLGVHVAVRGSAAYPPQLADDPAPPVVFFRVGSAISSEARRVAIVGTRRCTPAGREIATELGRALAEAGVRVVSGLALGIDGAAHLGALDAGAPPIGVVAGGFDRPYPARHQVLWNDVMARGTLVSEWPLGTKSEGWRFPARNRIIAGLSDAVVVVESRETGGSMLTADAALARGVPVLSMPGSIRNPAAAGTNRLIKEGATPACSVDDVFDLLSLTPRLASPAPRPAPAPASAPVLAALGWEPTPLGSLVTRTGLDPAELTVQLAHLELDGWVSGGGGWWQRC